MDLLKLPTDNLYKFMALAGLVLFVVSAISPFFFMRDEAQLLAEMGKTSGLMKVEVDQMERDLKREDAILASVNSATNKSRSARENELLSDQLTEARKINQQVLQRGYEVRKKGAEIDYAAEMSRFNLDVIRNVNRWSMRGMVFGALVTVTGFALWYSKLQRYQDEIVRAQAVSAAAIPDTLPAIRKDNEAGDTEKSRLV